MTEPQPQQQYDYDEIDLRDIFRTLGKWKYKIVSFTLICMLLSGIISWFYLDPVYEATTTIVVVQSQLPKESAGSVEDMVNQMGEIPFMSPESSVQQIKSPAILQAVIDKLKLNYTRSGLGSIIKTEQIKGTNLIRLTVAHSDPAKAASIANAVRQEFILHINRVNSQKLTKSLDIMEDQWMKKEETDLQKANEELRNYRLKTRSSEFLASQLAAKNQDLALCQSSLTQAEIERDKLKQGIEQEKENLKNTSPTIPSISTTGSNVPVDIGGLDLSNLKISSEKVNEAYTKSNEALNEKTTELAETEASLIKTRQKIQDLDSEIRVLEAELINNQIDEKKLRDEVERRENLVKLLSGKISEVKMTEAMDAAGNNILTVSEALVPQFPVKPNKVLNVAIAAVLGLMISVFGVFLIEYLHNEQ